MAIFDQELRAGRRRAGVWIACGLLAGLAMGCQGGDKAATATPQRKTPYIADVPLPQDFSLDETRSKHNVIQGMNVRIVDHYYVGSTSPSTVRAFYLQVMPENGWNLLKDEASEAVYTLRFRKETEGCQVRIRRNTAKSWLNPTEIRVMLEPEKEPVTTGR